ncbi:hypothetical protein NGUA36_04253 [Salmonella enterica]|nr:hypothetical protein NGUA36_04253 [Salmonella enterica]
MLIGVLSLLVYPVPSVGLLLHTQKSEISLIIIQGYGERIALLS